jgi:MarR family transcriptional regulator, transcriptional regulator for hemolysin
MQPETTPAPSLGYLLADVLRLLRRDFHTRASGLRLTPALARLLYYVHRQPGARQSELAALLDVTPVTLGRMIDRLVKHGYARRRADRADRRAVRVHLAPGGTPLVAQMTRIGELTTARATRGLTRRERRQLLELLGRLRANLSAGP